MNKSLPNLLSWTRIVLAPVISVLYFLGDWEAFAALFIYIVAAVTDYLDGKLAREYVGTNRFGAFLDPVADKVLVVCVLLTLLADPDSVVDRRLLGVLAAIVILRELTQSALRDWMAQEGKSADVAVTTLSKTKTSLQMVSLGVLLSLSTISWLLRDFASGELLVTGVAWIGMAMLAVAAALGLVTLVGFLRVAFAKGD